jgi:hypothetical protein
MLSSHMYFCPPNEHNKKRCQVLYSMLIVIFIDVKFFECVINKISITIVEIFIQI